MTITKCFFFIYWLGYRCLRAIGFLSGLAAGAGCIVWLQKQKITFVGPPADSAIAVVSGLFGAILGSFLSIAAALVSALSGALISGTVMAICIATLTQYDFGVCTL